MPALQFKKDQMSSWATYSCVIAEKSLPGLEKQIKDTLHLTDMKDLKDIGKNGPLMLKSWEALNNLPKVSSANCELSWYERRNIKDHDKLCVIGGVNRFSSEQKLSNYAISEQEFVKSTKDLEVLRKGLKKLNLLVHSDFLIKALDKLEKVHRLKKAIEKKDITSHEVSDELGTSFIENESVALFVRTVENKKMVEGFLGPRGDVVPLGRARMFDSEDAAQAFLNRTNTTYHFVSLQVVKVNLQITELGPTVQGKMAGVNDSKPSAIFEAIARVQKENIQQALQQASRDKLLERLQELNQEEEPISVAPKPRKM